MTVQNALDRIKLDTPMKTVPNRWQYETEIQTIQNFIDNYYQLMDGIKALDTLDKLNIRVILQAIDNAKKN